MVPVSDIESLTAISHSLVGIPAPVFVLQALFSLLATPVYYRTCHLSRSVYKFGALRLSITPWSAPAVADAGDLLDSVWLYVGCSGRPKHTFLFGFVIRCSGGVSESKELGESTLRTLSFRFYGA